MPSFKSKLDIFYLHSEYFIIEAETMRTNKAWNIRKKKGIEAKSSIKEIRPKVMVLVGYWAG